MSNFDEAKIRRAGDGKFATKGLAEAEGGTDIGLDCPAAHSPSVSTPRAGSRIMDEAETAAAIEQSRKVAELLGEKPEAVFNWIGSTPTMELEHGSFYCADGTDFEESGWVGCDTGGEVDHSGLDHASDPAAVAAWIKGRTATYAARYVD